MIREYRAKIWDNPSIANFSRIAPRKRFQKRFEIYSSITPAVLLLAAQATWDRYAVPRKKDSTKTPTKNQKAIALLDSWMREDAGDQSENWASLIKAIDENRTSHRKLFS